MLQKLTYNFHMKLIIGLGNPGIEYEETRHNIGFKSIDAFAHKKGLTLNKEKFSGVYYKGDNFILGKPLTYMNKSGEFVSKIMNFFKIDISDVLVIFDDIDLETAKIRFREKGSSGGQKGMQNIIDNLGTSNIKRLKIGVGRPKNGAANWVLGKFTKMQIEELNKKKDEIIKSINDFIEN